MRQVLGLLALCVCMQQLTQSIRATLCASICTCNFVLNHVSALQNDIHSPQTTVREALTFSASLRLTGVKLDNRAIADFVDEIMGVVELTPLKGALVGLPGESSTLGAVDHLMSSSLGRVARYVQGGLSTS